MKRQKPPLNRRETLADLARNLPWNKANNENGTQRVAQVSQRKRRESSAESGLRNMKQRRDSTFTRREERDDRDENTSPNSNDFQNVSTFVSFNELKFDFRIHLHQFLKTSRRGSSDSNVGGERKKLAKQKKRNDSLVAPDMANFSEQRPSTSSTASDSTPMMITGSNTVEMGCQAMAPPTIITSSGTPATSPTCQKGRRDSTTQCGKVRRSSRASPERIPRRLQRQVNVNFF